MHKRKKPIDHNLEIQPLLTIAEVANILNVGRTTVYGFIRRNGLPAVSLNEHGKLRVRRASLIRWIAEREGEGFIG